MATYEEIYQMEKVVADELERILSSKFDRVVTPYTTKTKKTPTLYVNVLNNGPTNHIHLIRDSNGVLEEAVNDTFNLIVEITLFAERKSTSIDKIPQYIADIKTLLQYKNVFNLTNHTVLDWTYSNTINQLSETNNEDIILITYNMVLGVNPDAWPQ